MTVNLTLNNGVQMPALGFGVFQSAKSARLSATRAWPATTCSSRPRSGSPTSATTRRCTRSTRAPATRRRPDRPVDPAPGAPHSVRPHPGGVSGAGGAVRRRAGAGDRRQQLHARAPGRLLAQATVVPAVNQVEIHPYFTQPAVQAADAAATASSPRPGRPSAGSPATAAPGPAPSTTRPSPRSPPPTARPRHR